MTRLAGEGGTDAIGERGEQADDDRGGRRRGRVRVPLRPSCRRDPESVPRDRLRHWSFLCLSWEPHPGDNEPFLRAARGSTRRWRPTGIRVAILRRMPPIHSGSGPPGWPAPPSADSVMFDVDRKDSGRRFCGERPTDAAALDGRQEAEALSVRRFPQANTGSILGENHVTVARTRPELDQVFLQGFGVETGVRPLGVAFVPASGVGSHRPRARRQEFEGGDLLAEQASEGDPTGPGLEGRLDDLTPAVADVRDIHLRIVDLDGEADRTVGGAADDEGRPGRDHAKEASQRCSAESHVVGLIGLFTDRDPLVSEAVDAPVAVNDLGPSGVDAQAVITTLVTRAMFPQ